MGVGTLIRYLIGDREAILALAANRWTLVRLPEGNELLAEMKRARSSYQAEQLEAKMHALTRGKDAGSR